ncbi:hexosaminidase [Povalibacter uvarum]|uniref:beta-N-acetylhexosaminidase n=1 Tax=Povalibacter uvarum TaxID=732238 RepID=A0A841HUK4_9GAMM|nr:family 20 glycosylhydrolase [Povalibacter uvarum]MBB6095949.1 hexosaminidase [Povalibacter uvarum]
MHQYKLFALTCGVFLALAGGCKRPEPVAPAPAKPAAIIPAPRELTAADGQFVVTADTPVSFESGSGGEAAARYLADLMQRTRGFALRPDASAKPDANGIIRFELTAGESRDGQDGYSLSISPQRIVVSAADSRGLFYGAVTLWQLMTPGAAADSIALPALAINDSPRFRWRGLMLDSARHFQSPQFIKQFIDWMALHKLNVLHWHLVDDQGWRLEIKKYPKLTSVGGWRVPAGPVAAADIDPATGKPRVYGGFYTQEEVRDIVAYAAERHIVIVPEIEMPGHASAAVAAYPELGVAGTKVPQVPADWGVYSTLFNVDDATFSFFEDVLTEVMALFPGEYIHVGGDEAVKDEWKGSPKIQAQMRKLGIKDEHGLQSYFIHRIEKFLNQHQRRLIGWDEILEGGLAPNATVMSWRGIDGAVAAATAGHDAVLAPQPALYFDNRQNGPNDPSPGRGWVISVESVYKFDPAPAALQPDQLKHILGLQAPIFTEHMRTEQRVEYMTFPRAAALAEVAWSPAERRDWADFQTRLPAQLGRYDALGIHYAPTDMALNAAAAGSQRRNSHQLNMCSDKLVLSLTDDAPLQGERAVFLVDIMNPCWIYQGADLSKASDLTAVVGQVPFNFQIGNDVKGIPLPKPQTPEGELEVRLDSCEGEKLATLPLAPATSQTLTSLPPAKIAPRAGQHDLCFIFTRKTVDPIWVIDSIELAATGE